MKPDLVFSLRDGYFDPAAYAPYYMPHTLGRLSIPERINFLRRLHGSPFRDRTVFLDIEPELAVIRIAERIEREKGMEGQLMRPKWAHQHENCRDLSLIRNEFLGVLTYLEARGTAFSLIDVNRRTRESVGEQLAKNILENI